MDSVMDLHRMRMHANRPLTVIYATVSVIIAATLTTAVWAAPRGTGIQGVRSVVVPTGSSMLLHFSHMKRVEVVEPALVAVIVPSFDELSLYGKKPGKTVVYVWDRTGVHEVSVSIIPERVTEKVITDLKGILGDRLTYSACGDRTIVVEGELPSAEAERARQIIARCPKGEVQIIDLIQVEGEGLTNAVAVGEALCKVLGDKLKYVAWGSDTILVQGALGDEEAVARARRLIAAANNRGVKIVDLIEVNEAADEAPVAEIARAIGDRYRVWRIQGRTVGIDGIVADQAELATLNKILETFNKRARIVNLVRVIPPRPDINAVMASLQEIVGNRLAVRPLDGDTLVLDGAVGSEAELKRVREVVASYPLPCRIVDLLHVALPERRQIVCHVRVVDVNKNELERLGVNWGQLSYSGDSVSFVDQPWLLQHMSGLGNPKGNGIQNVLPLGSQIDLLAQKNCARILSEPNLMVDDGEKATILIGGEIPIPVAQGVGGGTAVTVDWKQFGVQLGIEPAILEDGQKINLKIAPEVSSLDYSNAITVSGFTLPALRSRKASTVVTMGSGDTLVLGGLLQSEDSKVLRKIPLLGDLPVIGQLFRHKEFIGGQSELLILVTPEIIDKGALEAEHP